MNNADGFRIVLGIGLIGYFLLMVAIEIIVYYNNKPKQFSNDKELNNVLSRLQAEAERDEIYQI